MSNEESPQAWSPRTGRWQTLPAASADPAYLAADSWLVDRGRARGLDRHRARFAAAVAATGAHGAADVERFLDAVVADLPRDGERWFPRVELHADGTLARRVRLAPAPLDEVVVFGTAFPDRRRAPRTKGPDFPRQLSIRASVEAHDAGEALFTAPAGTVTEGVWTTPVWWDGDVLCALPRDAPVLDSVTRALLLRLAREHGVDVGRDTPSLARLRDCETWLLSALHGIRLVTGWLLVPGHEPEPAPHDPGRAALWRGRLDALAEPLMP